MSAAVLPGRIFSAEPIVIDRHIAVRPIGANCDYLEDKTGRLGIDDIRSGAKGGRDWTPGEDGAFNAGYTSSAYWFRFTLRNSSDADVILYAQEAYPLLNRVSFYWPGDGGNYHEIQSGTRYPFYRRPIAHRSFLFPLTVRAHTDMTVYLRVASEGTLSVPVFLCSPDDFNREWIAETMALWMLYGMLIIMAFYNLIIYVFIREKSYLYYVAYIALFVVTIMSLNGHASQHLWPNAVWWGNHCRPVLLGLIVAALCQFSREFLEMKRLSPKWDAYFKAIMEMSALSGLVVFVFDSYRICMLTTMFMAEAGIVSCFAFTTWAALAKKSTSAMVYLASFTPFFCGTIVYLLKSLGLLPESMFTSYFILIGAVIQATLYSLGLADNIRRLRDDLQSLNLRAIGTAPEKKQRIISLPIKEKMVRAIAFLEENYRSDISREGLASHLGMNADDFGRYFKLYTGKKVSDYCSELRIDEAAKMLRETAKSVTEIAFSVGFESLTTFNRAFMKVMKKTPSEYRSSGVN